MPEIPQFKTFDGLRFRRAGAYKKKSDAQRRAKSMREAWWKVRTTKFTHPEGIRYVNYRRE